MEEDGRVGDENAPITVSWAENRLCRRSEPRVLLIGRRQSGYDVEVIVSTARMAKLADAADLKSADPQGLWGFKSPSGHQELNLAEKKPRPV